MSERSTATPVAGAPGGALTMKDTARLVGRHVNAVVSRLQGGYLPASGRPTSAAVQTLALLRRALGAAGAADPRSWALVLEGLPDELAAPAAGSLAAPTRAERAIFTALTTYAVHQQSQPRPMHVAGVGLGEATRRLARQRARPDAVGGLDDATVQRLHRISLARTDEMRAQALRAAVQLMRSAEPAVGLDYRSLAQDLYWLQFPSAASRVHLRWGRGLHARSTEERTATRASEQQPTTQEGESA